MTEFSKWILAASADDPVRDVAARTLAVRLAAVQHFLPLAAEHSEENIEYVHQLRVATRRCVAALRLYRKILPKLPRKTLCRELKNIRQAAGRARDYDVLILHHCADSTRRERAAILCRRFAEAACEAQQPLRDINAVAGGESALAAVAAGAVRAGTRALVRPSQRRRLGLGPSDSCASRSRRFSPRNRRG